MKPILVVYGTRPEALKLAPVVNECRARGLSVTVWSTDQSPDLLDDAVLRPDKVLLLGIEGAEPPEDVGVVLVWGDTRTCLKTALWAYERGIPVMHGEAGVRSGDLSSPWPEEGFRRMISEIATYHACTTQYNWDNLSHVRWQSPLLSGRIGTRRVTGSPIVESVRERRAELWDKFPPDNNILLTLHRRENRGHFTEILDAVAASGMRVIWPAHPNNWAVLENRSVLQPVPPLSATHFAACMDSIALVVTDSGGVNEEAQTLRVPCVVARTVTDRPESLWSESNPGGCAFLGGNTTAGITEAIGKALAMDRNQIDPNIYGDGTASVKIAEWLREVVG